MARRRVSLRPGRRAQVVDLHEYRRKRLAALCDSAHAWDDGIPGHLAALLGCARTIEESVGGTQPSPESVVGLRYSFGLRKARVEKALDALAETRSEYSGYAGLLNSIRELSILLEKLHQSGRCASPVLIREATQLANQVDEDLWAALFDAYPVARQA